MKKINLKEKILTDVQAQTVRHMIVKSMEGVYTDKGEKPNEYFYSAAVAVADKIIKNTQMALTQSSVFEKAVKNSKPLKTKKSK